MSKTGIVYDDRFIEHATGKNHPECPDRLTAIRDELTTFGVWEQCVPIPARCATRTELMRCHTSHYLNNIEKIPSLAAGGVLNAVDWIMESQFRNALALVRPPGHHARRDGGGGFCIYNNVAIAAMHALTKHSLDKIMIVDWDIHHGDGTQEAFYDRDDVLFFSIHRHNLYPPTGLSEETGDGKGKGYTVNINLDLGFGNGMYEAVFSKILEPILWSYQPQLVLVSAGFDAYYLDDLGLMKVTSEGFVRMAYRLKKLTERMGHGRLLFCLEGGYHIKGLARTTRYLTETCLGKRTPLNILLREPPEFREVLSDIKKAHGDRWPGVGTDHHLIEMNGYLWDGERISTQDLKLDQRKAPEQNNFWIEASLGDAIVGRAKICSLGESAIVKFITTHDSMKKKGVASKIIHFLQDRHKRVIAQGVKYPARGFWTKLGFSPVPLSKNYHWPTSATIDKTSIISGG